MKSIYVGYQCQFDMMEADGSGAVIEDGIEGLRVIVVGGQACQNFGFVPAHAEFRGMGIEEWTIRLLIETVYRRIGPIEVSMATDVDE